MTLTPVSQSLQHQKTNFCMHACRDCTELRGRALWPDPRSRRTATRVVGPGRGLHPTHRGRVAPAHRAGGGGAVGARSSCRFSGSGQHRGWGLWERKYGAVTCAEHAGRGRGREQHGGHEQRGGAGRHPGGVQLPGALCMLSCGLVLCCGPYAVHAVVPRCAVHAVGWCCAVGRMLWLRAALCTLLAGAVLWAVCCACCGSALCCARCGLVLCGLVTHT